MAAAAAGTANETGKEDVHRSNTPSRETWAATVSHTVSIQPARITQAPRATGSKQIMTQRQSGMTGKAAAYTGHRPSASASSNRATLPTQASQHQPTDRDRDRDRMITR